MDQSGCKELFPESELARMLPKSLMNLYHRLKQRKEIEAAGLEGLEECPFCEYKVVIENAEEKLFREATSPNFSAGFDVYFTGCEGEDCKVVSCRACKKVDHLPKSCKEAEDDKHLDVRHAIEEAMSTLIISVFV
jgi:TRIAD3 protein (E3 ubiquitin-protein ligase RNF216)